MSTIVYSTNSVSLTLNGRVLNDLIAGDTMELAPVNPATARVNSASGVSISGRSDASVHTLTVRVQKNSQDDIFLNSARNGNEPTILEGSLKENFKRDGTDGVDSWSLEAGSVTTQPTSVKNNQDGNAVHEYQIEFRFCTRAI
jgi:hypothetical protein